MYRYDFCYPSLDTHPTCNGIRMAVCNNLELGHSLFCKLAHRKGHLSIRVGISYHHYHHKRNDLIHSVSLAPRKPILRELGRYIVHVI